MKVSVYSYTLTIIVSFLILISLHACDGSATVTNQPSEESSASVRITGVSDYDFVFDGKAGVNINFTSDEFEECTLTFAKASLKEGFTSSVSNAEKGGMDLSCLDSNLLYMLDDSDNTKASMTIESLDDSLANIKVSGNLYVIRADKYLNIKELSLSIEGENLRKLVR